MKHQAGFTLLEASVVIVSVIILLAVLFIIMR
jgi:type II secretory pathway pseudopilin PulG